MIEQRVEELEIFKSFQASKYSCLKQNTYFQVYEELLTPYRNKPITFIEVGVFNGGSLFMWRDFLGPEARIIGIDLNPLAQKWEADGFEIRIGNQADPAFWTNLFSEVGDVDVVLDDGGHTNEQQIVTTHQCIPHIRDGGLMIVEDVHTSYFREFGNPSPYSFINFCKGVIDRVNSRHPDVCVQNHTLRDTVYSVAFFESIVALRVDRRRCLTSAPITNGGVSSDAYDYRSRADLQQLRNVKNLLNDRLAFLARIPAIAAAQRWISANVVKIHKRLRNRQLKRYFSHVLKSPTR